MSIINPEAEAYCTSMSDTEPSILKDINRDTHANVLQPRMLSGHFQGRFLSLLTHIAQPTNVLEIGTYTGYSAICLAEGLQKNGKVISIDINEENQSLAESNIAKANQANNIELITGDALKVIPELKETFDLVFIDADKLNYSNYYDLVIDKINPNGLIVCDNILWSGKVYDNISKDKTTVVLREFNQKLKEDPRIQKVLLPIRDGLFIARKI